MNAFANALETFKQSIEISKQYSEKLEKELTDLLMIQGALEESVLVVVINKDGKITYVNDFVTEITGFEKKYFEGKDWKILCSKHHKPEFYEMIKKNLFNKTIWKGQVGYVDKNGDDIWLKTTAVPLDGYEGNLDRIVTISTDQTSQIQSKERLAQAMRELKKTETMKEEFVSMVTHELKTPLVPVVGYIDYLKDPRISPNLSQEQYDCIKSIEKNISNLQSLIGDILDAHKLDLNKMKFNLEEFDVNEFLDKLHEDMQHFVKNKGIKLVKKSHPNLKMVTDEKRLRQIFENLIKNSVDFVSENKGIIEFGALHTNESTGAVTFFVKDNGIGIPKRKQKNLFKKFYQVDTSSRRQHGGTGLGLVICKGITESLKGQISVKSEEEKGTKFEFTMPSNPLMKNAEVL